MSPRTSPAPTIQDVLAEFAEQRKASQNPRSTVGTVTEIYDYLRLLFARIGKPYCYNCGKAIQRQTVQQMVDQILALEQGTKIQILAPVIRGRKGEYKDIFEEARRDGFVRVRIDGEMLDLSQQIKLDKNKKHNIEIVVDRLIVDPKIDTRLADSLQTALLIASGIVLVDVMNAGNNGAARELLFSEHFACVDCGISYEELAPRMFSFNSPYGACQMCNGLGTKMEVDTSLIVPDSSRSLNQGAIATWNESREGWYFTQLQSVAEHYGIDMDKPWEQLAPEQRAIVLNGSNGEEIRFVYQRESKKLNYEFSSTYEGVIPNLERRYKQTESNHIRSWIEEFMNVKPCPACQGGRLRKEAQSVRVGNLSIKEVTALSIDKCYEFFEQIQLSQREQEIAHQVLKEIRERLGFLVNVGLGYLSLERSAGTLSGGEAQRIRLATQVGSQLVGVLYILDEPSIGLHQRDNKRLLNTLQQLRDLGNTVVVVEHDQETIESADFVLDLGPGAGAHGGDIVATGTSQEIAACSKSLTGQYLAGKKCIPAPKKRRKGSGEFIRLRQAAGNNLKKVDVDIPLGVFNCVTGVSGSGKSTLINETLYRILARHFYRSKEQPLAYDEIQGLQHVDKVIEIDQSPIGRTPRSNPATYTGLFTYIRDLFSQVPEAKIRGYKVGRFSFNVKGGRCEACQGDGVIKIEMHFLPDVYVSCEVCKGRRYNRETLEIKYKGKSISDVLDMTVSEALQTLFDVGLGYVHLGQQATTLSGGEAQRVKLATELSKVSTSKTVYILDEPTTGLHFEDIKMLLNVLNRLVDKGNTVIVIEHNLDVIKTADYILDLGPEGGDKGGRIIATGTPEQVARSKVSYTGEFLQRELKKVSC